MRDRSPGGSDRPPPTADRRRRHALAFLAVFAAALLLYAPSLRYGFIGYDDTLLIVQNREFLRDLSNLPQAFRQDAFLVPGYESSGAYYRPLVTVSLILDAQIGGETPAIYHATNVLLHGIASALVLALLFALGAPLGAALFLSLAFAVHPVLVSAVAWVPGRVEVLLAVWAVASTLCLVAWKRGVVGRRSSRGFFLLHLGFFAAALFTKESAVLLPVPWALWIAAELAGRRNAADIAGERSTTDLAARTGVGTGANRRGPAFGRFGRILQAKGGWVLLLLVWFLLRRSAVEPPLPAAELLWYLWSNATVALQYLGKAVIPVGLAVTPTIEDTPLWTGIAAAGVLIAALAFSRERRWPRIAFGLAWFLILVVPSLVVPRRAGLEQRLYLPLVGLLVVLLEVQWIRALGGLRLGRVVAGVVLAALAGITFTRVPDYGDRTRFWESAVRTAPHSSIARASLGAVYMGLDRTEEARVQYERALDIDPAEPTVNGNLGVLAARAGQMEEAERYLRAEVEVNPRYANGWFNLAQLYYQSGRLEAAAAAWERTAELEPAHRPALERLIGFYGSRGDTVRALEYLERLEHGRAPR